MPRIMPDEQLNLIHRVISKHPQGLGISSLEKELADHLPKPLTRRTLQRRLKRLLEQKRITSKGSSRGDRPVAPTAISIFVKVNSNRFYYLHIFRHWIVKFYFARHFGATLWIVDTIQRSGMKKKMLYPPPPFPI